jgi:hypothetical protein
MFLKILVFIGLLNFSGLFAADLDISTLVDAGNSDIKTIVETFALGGDYKAVHYATPEGMILGVDVGIEITAINVSDDFKNALAVTGNSSDDIPSYIPVPRLNITKGLPLGFDVGFSILKVNIQGIDILNYGGSVKYAILNGSGILPAVAVRGTFNKGKYFDIVETSTFGLEAIVSKSFLIIEPFGGIGFQKGKGKINIDDFLSSDLPVDTSDINYEPSVSQARVFIGATLKLALFHLAIQADYGKVKTFSTKLGLNF